jgi:hypothetical protein
MHTSPPRPWFASPRLQRAVLVIFVGILLVEGVQAVFYRQNDVANHYTNGRKLWGWEPRAHEGAEAYWYVPYPAGRSALNATLAWLPVHGFRAALYVLGLASLVASLVIWERMARGNRPVSKGVPFAAAAASVVLLLPWLVRDFDDCGLQLLLLFMLTAVIDNVNRGREWRGGAWLGLAIVYKASPLLLVPGLLLTGRWKACVAAVIVIAAISASPALFIGWNATVEFNTEFVKLTRANANLGNPTENGFEPPRHQNQGLVISLARVLQTYTPEHPLYLDHPAFVQFFDLPPATADKIAKSTIALGLLYLVGWRMIGQTWRKGRDSDGLREAAAITALCAVLSPMAWVQHLVLCFPAAYLVLRDVFERLANGERIPRRNSIGLVAAAVFIYVFSRGVVGRELSVVFLSYKVNTIAALLLVGLVLAMPRAKNAAMNATGKTTEAPSDAIAKAA